MGLIRGKRVEKTSTDKRNFWLKIRISQTENDAIQRLSQETGVAISEIIRIRLLGDTFEKTVEEIRKNISERKSSMNNSE